MAKKAQNSCPQCQQDNNCYYAQLLRDSDIGILQQEVRPEPACWRAWVQEMGADPDRLINRLQLPERNFKVDRSLVVKALLTLLEPADPPPPQQPFAECLDGYTELFARDCWGEGYFLVGEGYGDDDVFDVDQYDKLIEEARTVDVHPPYHVFAHRQRFTSPNVHFIQLDACDIKRMLIAGKEPSKQDRV